MQSNTLPYLLQTFEPILSRSGVEEIAMQEPDVAWIWQRGKFHCTEVAFDAHDIEDLATVAAAQRRLDVGPNDPLLGVEISDRLRLQIVLPPCTRLGKPAMVIRQGSEALPTLVQLNEQGYFKRTHPFVDGMSVADTELLELYKAGDWLAFMQGCAKHKKTTVICGETGSGKTHLGKARIDAIPKETRLILMADTDEHASIEHPNKVDMFWGKSGVRALQIAEAALRMRIGVPVLGEIRDGEAALAFVSLELSGHPGGVTTMHAPNCRAAKRTLRMRIKQTEEGRALNDDDINEMLDDVIDVIVHCYRRDDPDTGISEWGMDDIWFGPAERATCAA
jgi:type IV secretory pathway ATPase VirB11/archaellum biosynthesis ATPase